LLFIESQFPNDFDGLLEKLSLITTKDTQSRLALELSFTKITKDYSKVKSVIIESKDLALLVKYNKLFWDIGEEDTIELYKNLSINFLETHYGEPAQVFIQEMVKQIAESGHPEAAKRIKNFINEKYGERNLFDFKLQIPSL
jgi:hypothetical protein